MSSITVPVYDETIEAVTIVRWLCHEGDFVAEGDELLEVIAREITDTIIAEDRGILTHIRFREGDVVMVGDIIAELEEEPD